MRYLDTILENFAREKFVFVSGPRQVGKTTLAKTWLGDKSDGYLNWDIARDRQEIRRIFRTNETELEHLVLDEIHKYARWKTSIKGLYDGLFPRLHVVVTGSARLDVYQRGGDSLLGRYEHIRLHPLSIGELSRLDEGLVHEPTPPPSRPEAWLELRQPLKMTAALGPIWDRLEKFSGFPEPYYKANGLARQRWALKRKELVLREDLRDLTQVKAISLVEDLAERLPSRVSGLLSINSLREELGVAFDTVKSWLEILERLYYCYRLHPYSDKVSRSLSKETKLYLWDWTEVENEGARFENMVAGHLLKAVHYWRDLGFGDYDLQYWRNREKLEVDFIVTLKRRPVVAIECKFSDSTLSHGLRRFSDSLSRQRIPVVQLVRSEGILRHVPGGLIVSASSFLARLP